MLYTTSYIYGGGFENNVFRGDGTLIFKDGDVVNSDFGAYQARGHSVGVNNRYARGQPIGKNSTISFSDGSFYDGEMQNGTITGNGIYISATG